MNHADDPDPVLIRLREGFERVALVLRADLWAAAGDAGVNPIQARPDTADPASFDIVDDLAPGIRVGSLIAAPGTASARREPAAEGCDEAGCRLPEESRP